jgi:hypothetical protein
VERHLPILAEFSPACEFRRFDYPKGELTDQGSVSMIFDAFGTF